MNRSSHYQLWPLLVLLAAFAGPPSARADALSAVQVLREGGCGGIAPAARPLHHNLALDRVAEQWAAGRSLSVAAEGSGWRAESTSGLRVSGPDSSMLQLLRNSDCRMLTSQRLRDIGVYRRGLDSWLVLGSVAKASADSWTPVSTAAPAPPTGGDRATL